MILYISVKWKTSALQKIVSREWKDKPHARATSDNGMVQNTERTLWTQ